MRLRFSSWLAALFLLLGYGFLAGGTASAQSSDTTGTFRQLEFRNLGPAVAGGRVTAVRGVPGQPNVYYVGAAGGGVWKTTNGGTSWSAIFEDHPPSIGDITLAPSNPNLVWVGTGEPNIRVDLIDGHGVYFSPDGGTTWESKGLNDVGQIAKVAVSPEDPNTVFVGAIGHAWGPNEERGLFKSTDGGDSWENVLFVNDSTGVSDVLFKPGNPRVMYAATWQVMRTPWTLINGGHGSAIWRSKDGGDTWTKLTKGLPKGKLGRIELAAAPSNPDHIYALIGSQQGVLWETTDGGDSWRLVSNNHALDVRPFYFSTMTVAPDNEDRLYFLSFHTLLSKDGGKTVQEIDEGVHVDGHDVWVDPQNPDRLIIGNDGGAYASTNGGQTWHYFNNLPIQQYYQIATSAHQPYRIGGGLQDNSGWFGPQNNLHGGSINGTEWYTAIGGDGEYIVPAPSDPNTLYAELQNGYLVRRNLEDGTSQFIRPYFLGAGDRKPSELKYRFNWTTPVAVSPTDAQTVYIGANVLFRSTTGGRNWDAISPDLTRDDESKQVLAGEPIMHDLSGAESYNTILSIGLSQRNEDVIWVGTDDGQVQVTRDGGQSWTNVTDNIPDMKPWGRIYNIEVSPFDPATCYVAYDRHMLDDRASYVYKTTDYGEHWTTITDGLPEDQPVYVVRENPNQQGFLVLGNDAGLYYSRNGGAQWEALKGNAFPTASVWDLKFVENQHDLVVATHGRGAFVLDDLRPLEEMTGAVKQKDFHLFSLQPAVMYNRWYRSNGTNTPSAYTAPNPPDGAVIDYYLESAIEKTDQQKKKGTTPVEITITSAAGDTVNTLYGPAKAGVNRFVWDLDYKGPERLDFGEEAEERTSANNTGGPRVLPGTYTVAVTVQGETQTQSLTVEPDPNLPFDEAAMREQQHAIFHVQELQTTLNRMLNRIHNLNTQLENAQHAIQEQDDSAPYATVLQRADSLSQALTSLQDTLMLTRAQDVTQDDIHYLSRFRDKLGSPGFFLSGYNQAPTPYQQDFIDELETQLQAYVQRYNRAIRTELPAYNEAARSAEAPRLIPVEPVQMPGSR